MAFRLPCFRKNNCFFTFKCLVAEGVERHRHPKRWYSGEILRVIFYIGKSIIFIRSLQKTIINYVLWNYIMSLTQIWVEINKVEIFPSTKNIFVFVLQNITIILTVILSNLTDWGRVVHAAPSQSVVSASVNKKSVAIWSITWLGPRAVWCKIPTCWKADRERQNFFIFF